MRIRDMSSEMRLMLLAMIIANTAGNMYVPLLPLYLETLGATIGQVGVFFTVMTVFAISSRLLGGWVSDHIGRIQTIAIGGVLNVTAVLTYTLAPDWGWAMFAALFATTGGSMVHPSFDAYIAEQAPEGKTGSAFGLIGGIFLICQIIGPLMAGLIVRSAGYPAMMWTATIILSIAGVIRLAMVRGKTFDFSKLDTRVLRRDVVTLSGLLLSSGVLFWLFVVDGLFDSGFQVVLPFLPKYSTEVAGLDEAGYGAMLAWMSIVAVGGYVLGGLFVDRFSPRMGMVVAALGFLAAWTTLLRWPTPPGLAVAFALAGLATSFIQPAIMTVISEAVPKESLGMTIGLFSTALGVLAVPAPAIGGLLYDNLSPAAPFLVSVLLILIATPLIYWKLRTPAAADAGEAVPAVAD